MPTLLCDLFLTRRCRLALCRRTGRVSLLRWGDLPGTSAALLAESLFDPIVEESRAQSHRSAAGRAHELQVGQLHGHILLEHASLRIFLAAANVFLNAVDAFDNRLAGGAIHLNHATALAAIIANLSQDPPARKEAEG